MLLILKCVSIYDLLENSQEIFGTLENSIELSELRKVFKEFDLRTGSYKVPLVTTIHNLMNTTSKNMKIHELVKENAS